MVPGAEIFVTDLFSITSQRIDGYCSFCHVTHRTNLLFSLFKAILVHFYTSCGVVRDELLFTDEIHLYHMENS